MSTVIDKKAISKLSIDEKLDLIDELWASIEGDADVSIAPEQVAEMKRRLAWADANPDKCLSYEEYKAFIRRFM